MFVLFFMSESKCIQQRSGAVASAGGVPILANRNGPGMARVVESFGEHRAHPSAIWPSFLLVS